MKTTDNIKIYLHTRRIASLVGVAKRKSSVHTAKEREKKSSVVDSNADTKSETTICWYGKSLNKLIIVK